MVVSLIPLFAFFGSTIATDTCENNGDIIQHRDQFMIHKKGICIVYICDQGHWVTIGSGCLLHDLCHYVGENFTVDCVKYQCTQQSGEYNYTLTQFEEKGCCTWMNQSGYEDGIVYLPPNNWGCHKMLCNHGRWTLLLSQRICTVGDTCQEIDSEYYMDDCRRYVCINSSGNPTNQFLEQHCNASGTCQEIGSEYYMDGCKRYVCVNDSSGNSANQFLEQHCNASGSCQEIGSEYYMDGCKRYACVNDSSGNSANQFLEQHCDTGTSCKRVGEEYYMNQCRLYVCTKDELGNVANTFREQHCRDHNGQCHPPGEAFQDEIDSICYSCTCKRRMINDYPIHLCYVGSG